MLHKSVLNHPSKIAINRTLATCPKSKISICLICQECFVFYENVFDNVLALLVLISLDSLNFMLDVRYGCNQLSHFWLKPAFFQNSHNVQFLWLYILKQQCYVDTINASVSNVFSNDLYFYSFTWILMSLLGFGRYFVNISHFTILQQLVYFLAYTKYSFCKKLLPSWLPFWILGMLPRYDQSDGD